MRTITICVSDDDVAEALDELVEERIRPVLEANRELRHQLTSVIDAPMNGGWLSEAVYADPKIVLIEQDILMDLAEALEDWLEATKEPAEEVDR